MRVLQTDEISASSFSILVLEELQVHVLLSGDMEIVKPGHSQQQ